VTASSASPSPPGILQLGAAGAAAARGGKAFAPAGPQCARYGWGGRLPAGGEAVGVVRAVPAGLRGHHPPQGVQSGWSNAGGAGHDGQRGGGGGGGRGAMGGGRNSDHVEISGAAGSSSSSPQERLSACCISLQTSTSLWPAEAAAAAAAVLD
jgi:hypothetical protein